MDFLGKTLDHIRKQLKDIKPFSWQVSLLLSLFAWFTYLLIRDPAVKQFVSLFGWFFLIIGTDWALMKQEFTIPGVQLKIKYGAWLTGAFISCAFWSNNFIIHDIQGALITWPLFSVLCAGYSRFIQPGPTFKTPSPDQRRDLVILALVGMLLSCWFRFHFLLQDYLQHYPSIAADNVDRSAFVVRMNPSSVPTSGGVAILDSAEAIVRSELSKRSWIDAQRWLTTLPSQISTIGSQALSEAYKNAPSVKETDLWRFNAQYSRSIPTNLLQLQVFWLGPSSQPGGYVLQKVCAISEALPQPFVEGAAPPPAPPTLYRMDCGAIESSIPGVHIQKPAPLNQQAGNFLERVLNAALDLWRGFVDLLGRLLGIGREG
ncbi:MAG TPA: DUF5357 family protein [Coleofasciculaceae cyanobacterium]